MMGDSVKLECPQCRALVAEDTEFCPHCSTPILKEPDTVSYAPVRRIHDDGSVSFSPGDLFADRYLIVEEIGRGGMGRVYKADDTILRTPVALKIIRPEFASSARFVELFRTETLLARSLAHENIIRIYDMGETGGIKYISMEYVEGQNLKELIGASGSLTMKTSIRFALQICQALSAAHRKGVVHRDLKPKNIMIDHSGKVVAMDFGLAKSVEDEETRTGRPISGTPQYLSPEQARGDKADQRADIYALGLIMHEMVAGEPLYRSDTLAGYIHKHLHVAPTPASRINPLVPLQLERIILKCLEKNKEKRYQSVEDVREDLERIKLPQIPDVGRRTRRILRTAGLAALVLSVAAVLYFLINPLRPSPPPAQDGRKMIAVMPFENSTGDDSRDYFERVLQEAFVQDLYQSKFLRILAPEKIKQHLQALDVAPSDRLSAEALDLIAGQENVMYFISGSFATIEEGYAITLRILDAKTRDIMATKADTIESMAAYAQFVDSMTPWIKGELKLTAYELSTDIDEEIKKFSTKDIDAFVYYLDGLQLFRSGEFEESIIPLKRAVAIDEGFAAAYSLMAIVYSYVGLAQESEAALLKAWELRDERMTPRDRFTIQADYYNLYESAFDKAIASYRELLTVYPQDSVAYEDLGGVYRNIEEWDSAEECFQRALEIDPHSSIAVGNLIWIYQAQGDYDRAVKFLTEHRDVLGGEGEFHHELAQIHFNLGKFSRALVEVGMASGKDHENIENSFLLGHIYRALGDFEEAEKAYRAGLASENPVDRLRAYDWLAHLSYLQGNYLKCHDMIDAGMEITSAENLIYDECACLIKKAKVFVAQRDYRNVLSAVEKAIVRSREIRNKPLEVLALLFRGLGQIGLKDYAAAEETARILKSTIQSMGYSKYLRNYDYLMALIAMEQSRLEEAAGLFQQACSTLPRQYYVVDPHAFYLFPLAEAYYRSGDLTRAQAKYKEITSLTTGQLRWGDAYARAHFMLGKIYLQRGETDQAAVWLNRYLNLRKMADPDHPEVEEAQKMLSKLTDANG